MKISDENSGNNNVPVDLLIHPVTYVIIIFFNVYFYQHNIKIGKNSCAITKYITLRMIKHVLYIATTSIERESGGGGGGG